ncbi:MAG: CAP domain-containing protein [Burkholderiaceae bacterium]|nr:CAP domain-containing protein [Burkholderiaceae bacterium]MDZ4146122.1 CAP domain-containing protein [Burkholderiales bacterium]
MAKNKPECFKDAAHRPARGALLCLAMAMAAVGCGGGGTDTPAGPAAGAVTGTPVNDAGGTAAPPPATPPAPAPVVLDASVTCGISNFQALILQQINTARAQARSCGSTAFAATTALAWSDPLFAAAAKHSADMARNNFFSHTSLDGRTPGQRITAEGYAWRSFGENIAAGQGSIDVVMAGWLASPGHCANIMATGFADVAMACVRQSGSTYGTYWTMDLARR